MENKFDTNKINIAIEDTPFLKEPAQSFFVSWCEINGSITPKFIDREEWEERGLQGILEKNDQGIQTLFLPTDLHFWEMIDVIKTIDHDTLARDPEKRTERTNKIQELGVIFEQAGLYLSEYIPDLEDGKGKSIAEEMALSFYQYGLSLQSKERKNDQIPKNVQLSEEDKTKLDEWFLGRDVYQKRLARLGENPTVEQKDDLRKHTLSVYFNTLSRNGYRAVSEKPWKSKVGPMQHLQDRIKKQIEKYIKAPEREMKTAFFRRGVERLLTEMKEVGWRKEVNSFLKVFGFDPIIEQRKIYDTLHVDDLKQELAEVRKTGDIAQISSKELEIAKKIQKAVSGFPYISTSIGNNPSEMVETQLINCVGSSILGGGLLDEIGIKYLHVDLPEHSATVLITSDGKIRWQDFTPGMSLWNFYKEIQDKDITGQNIHGKPLTSEDIVEFAKNPTDKGILFEINRSWCNQDLREIILPSRHIGLHNPEVGLQIHILCNIGKLLKKLGKNEEAVAAYQQAINVEPNVSTPYNGLGNALRDLGRKEEAIEAYHQAINIDPTDAYPYNGLGNVLKDLGRNEEAVIVYRQAISVDPKFSSPYNGLGNALRDLGRKEEAIEAYRKFLANWYGDVYWTNRANQEIDKLQNK